MSETKFNEPRLALNRIYTRQGDSGDTSLVGGQRLHKDALRIECYGTVDELNSFIGLACLSACEKLPALGAILLRIQHELFNLGSILIAGVADGAGRHRAHLLQVEFANRLRRARQVGANEPHGVFRNGAALNTPVVPIPPVPVVPRCSFPKAFTDFVKKNMLASTNLGALSGISGIDILAWASLESGWGTNSLAVNQNNFFSWAGPGNVEPCPGPWGCFTGFFSSGWTALFSTNNNFTYNGQTHVSTDSILTSQFDQGASITTAFQALANAGYDRKDAATYGKAVSARVGKIISILLCLSGTW